MATTTTVSVLQKPRRASEYDAAYLALRLYADRLLTRTDLLSDKRLCAEVAYRADATRLDKFRLAPAEVVQLFRELGFHNNWHPLFTYDSKSQTLVVRHTLSTAQNCVCRAWMDAFSDLGNIGLRQHGIVMRAIPSRAYIPSRTTLADRIMAGDSVLTADWTLYLDPKRKSTISRPVAPVLTPRFVISVSFQADGRAELVRDAQRWLESAASVAGIVLVTIIEEPRYVCPLTLDRLEKADLPPRDAFADLWCPYPDMGVMSPISDPIEFAGHRWTGKFTHVWSETWWRRDTPSGPRATLEEGSRQDLLAEHDTRPLEIPLQPIAGSELSLSPEQARYNLAFDKKAFRKEFLADAARDLALQRYDRALAVQAMLRGSFYKRRHNDRV